jgi:hypothetical protein
MVSYETHEVVSYSLTPEGQQIAEQGSHEARVWAALSEKGGPPVSIKDLKAKVGDESSKVGQGRAFKNGWIVKDGDNLYKSVSDLPNSISFVELLTRYLFAGIQYPRRHSGRNERSRYYGHAESRG